MTTPLEDGLLQAIKKDDIKAFNALMENAQCGTLRLGRFPVLSLMYLYKSHKLLAIHEQGFLKIKDFTPLREPIEISKKFSKKAGKSLRLYFDEIVSPLEMLLILDKTTRLKRLYPLAKPSAAVKERLKSIYNIKYSLNIKFEGESIVIDRRPLNYREKKKIAAVCMCSLLAVAVAVATPVTAVALMPPEGDVTKLSQINFASQKEYTLKKDIVVPENFNVEKVNCNIYGEGNKLIFGKGATLGELNGTVSDLIIESSGTTVFNSVSENAAIKNVTVNVNADAVATEATALVALTNYGTIDGITVNVNGKINALATTNEALSELSFGGIVQYNGYKNALNIGVIKNCAVNYSQFELIGEAAANAAFGGIAGINAGYVQDCTVSGEIIADTFDVAGICLVNNGYLSGNLNEANLLQTSDNSGWNPIACGIVLTNNNIVEYCENTGKISSASTCEQTEEGNVPTVSAAGISYLNYGGIGYSLNSGEVSAVGNGMAFVGGISSRSCSQIINCVLSGDINVTAKEVRAGGIFGFGEVAFNYNYTLVYFGTANYCISESKINVTVIGDEPAYVGGIAGCVSEAGYRGTYYGGCVTNCYFTGECVSERTYFGNIVGVCGANIYESNSYLSGDTEYRNFENNYYLDNNYYAFGAKAEAEEKLVEVFDDKGAAFATIEEIQNQENYKSILNAIKK